MMESSNSDIILFENEIADFYHAIIPSIFDLRCNELMRGCYSALKDIRQLKYDNDNKDKLFYSCVNFNKPAFRLAYMYAYTVLNSTVVYKHFLNYLSNNESVISKCILEKKIQICCLGGGPGIEAVSICKAINNFFLQSKNENKLLALDAYITVIDICKEWETDLISIVNAVSKHISFLPPKRIKLHVNFLQADLLKPLENNLEEEIKKADIVTMVKLASSIAEKTSDNTLSKINKMVKNVIGCVNEGSSFFLLDNAGGSCFRRLLAMLYNNSSQSKIETMAHEKHSLNPQALQKMEKLISYNKKLSFALCLPTRITTVSSCLWVKKKKIAESTDSEKFQFDEKICVGKSHSTVAGNWYDAEPCGSFKNDNSEPENGKTNIKEEENIGAKSRDAVCNTTLSGNFNDHISSLKASDKLSRESASAAGECADNSHVNIQMLKSSLENTEDIDVLNIDDI